MHALTTLLSRSLPRPLHATRLGPWWLAGALALAAALPAHAGPLRERLQGRDTAAAELADDADAGAPARRAALPAGVLLERDRAYGPDPRQRLDIYRPRDARPGAPVVLLVHGGAWRTGDKAYGRLVEHKVARWVPQGVVLVSANYRLLPQAGVADQLQDVVRALAWVQRHAADWGGDPHRVVAMGHSAGAHLVALLAASPAVAQAAGAQPAVATVALDSAALDVPRIMEARHLPLYDAAFGGDPAGWQALSPLHQLRQPAAPLLAVCSSQRAVACDQAQRFARHAQTQGTRVEVLPQALSHGAINAELGQPNAYTEAVEAFLRSVDPGFGR